MEYEFARDPVKGGYHAKFSMEHEVFSTWLVDEVGNDSQRIELLFQHIEKARTQHHQDLTVQGREYLLTINEQDVTLELNVSCDGIGGTDSFDDGLEDEFSVNNDHYRAACGLDDFSLMLTSWKDFLSS